ncbi:anti-sigma factor [Sphaerisporangium perillae]|uniref:anti-sigma factor n=1 Tax=Sphaerisporangium perillae TaxID=2935860 RepID=UPI00200BE22E|nr:anti-sigma factor [Sphaerisporangium perillae]
MSSDPHTLAGAYAMYAVEDADERRAFEEHLSRCPECEEEARGLRETAARLGVAVAQEPPPGLRDRVMAEIGLVRQLPPILDPASAPGRRAAARRAWWPRAATGLAAACLAVAVGLGVVAVRANDALQQERLGGQRIAAVLAAPDAKTVTRTAGQGAKGTLVVSRSQGQVVFFSSGLAALPESRTYQLWRIGPGGAVPDRLTRPDTEGRTPPVVIGELGDATKIGVTVEPAGGSRQPSAPPLMVVPLPSA